MGQGIGTALLDAAIAHCRSFGLSQLTIDSDPNAEPFYAARGARRVEKLRHRSTACPTACGRKWSSISERDAALKTKPAGAGFVCLIRLQIYIRTSLLFSTLILSTHLECGCGVVGKGAGGSVSSSFTMNDSRFLSGVFSILMAGIGAAYGTGQWYTSLPRLPPTLWPSTPPERRRSLRQQHQRLHL